MRHDRNQATTSPLAAADELESVATAARQALGCDAILITQQSPAGRRTVVAAAGITPQELRRAWPVLKATEEGVTTRTGQQPHLSCNALAHDRSKSVHCCAPLDFEGVRVGSLHALGGPDGHRIDLTLFEAFAAHFAIALGHRHLRQRALRLAERVRHGEALDRIALSATTLAELLPHIDEAMCRVFGPVSTGVMVWDDDRSVLQLVGGSFDATESETASYQVDPRDLHSNAARVFGLQRPYLSNHAAGDPGILQDYVETFRIRRLISVPLVVAAQPTGVLHVANKGANFGVEDLARCEELAPRVALVVESTRMLMRLRTQQRLETVLSGVAVAIASGQPAEHLLTEGLEALRNLADASMIALVPVESEPVLTGGGSLGLGTERCLIQDARRARRESSRVTRPQRAGDPGSAVYHVPVRLGTRRLGTLSVLRACGRAFTKQERSGLARMSDLVALAWASERDQQHRAELARMEERQRIADDLHDEVAQLLFAAQMHLDGVLEGQCLDPPVTEAMVRARALLTRADTTIRTEISQLSRPASNNFVDRLRDVVDSVEEEFTLVVHLDISSAADQVCRASRTAVRETLLKVARESLVNAAKHAGPCRVRICLDLVSDGRLRLQVSDDGIGLQDPSDDNHHGMASLRRSVRRHGGSMRVLRGARGGTTVAVRVPL